MNRIALSEQDKANYKAVSLFVAVGATMICEMWMCFASFFFALNWLVCQMLIPEALTREKGCTIQLDRLLISDIKCSVFLLAILNKCGATAKPVVEMIYLAAVQHG